MPDQPPNGWRLSGERAARGMLTRFGGHWIGWLSRSQPSKAADGTMDMRRADAQVTWIA